MVNQKPELSAQNLEVLKQMMMDNLRDSRWEMRDCVLELLADLLPMISKSTYIFLSPCISDLIWDRKLQYK